MVGYKRVNQQKIYNSKIRKIYILTFIWFNKEFNLYDNSHEIIDKDDNSVKFGHIQDKVDNSKFDKIIARKSEKSIITNNKKEKDTKNFLEFTIDHNHSLPNWPMPSPKISKNTPSFLPNIFGANTSLLIKLFLNSINKKDILELPNILQGNNILDQLESLCQSYIKFRVIKHFDYKNFKKLSKVISIFQSYNISYAKHISLSHIYII